MYSNNILNFEESTTILNAYTKKSGNLLKAPRVFQHRARDFFQLQHSFYLFESFIYLVILASRKFIDGSCSDPVFISQAEGGVSVA